MKGRDFLIEIELAGLTSRLKRLSDNILYSTKEFYKEVETDIQPNWHLIFLLLKEHKVLNITEVSEKLQLSHPAVIKIIKKMKEKEYVLTETDNLDSRKQVISLSDKAHRSLPQFEKYWNACLQTMNELVEDNPGFLNALENMERKVKEKSYKDRTLKNLKK